MKGRGFMKKVLAVARAVFCLVLAIAMTRWFIEIEESLDVSRLLQFEMCLGWLGAWIIFFLSFGAIFKPEDETEGDAMPLWQNFWREFWPAYRSGIRFIGRLLICFNIMAAPFMLIEWLFKPSAIAYFAVMGALLLFSAICEKLSLFDGMNAKLSQRMREGRGIIGWVFKSLGEAFDDVRT